MNKYINLVNGNLVLTKAENKVKYKILDDLSAYHDFYMIKAKGNYLIEFTDRVSNKCYEAYIDLLRDSGIEGNLAKRLHIRKNDFNLNIFPIGIYNAGINDIFFVYFSDGSILENKSDNNKSVWVDFKYIYYYAKNREDIKYASNSREKYFIYITNDIRKILNQEFDDFLTINDKDIKDVKKNIDDFIKNNLQNNNNELDQIIYNQLFTNEENKLSIYDSETNDFFREAEWLFNNLIESNPELICDKFKLKKINNYTWLNKYKESYLPYDFIINENIFIDVKCTLNDKPSFFLSENEYNFMNDCIKESKKYFIVNLISVNLLNKRKWHFLTANEINEMNQKQKTEYKFWED